MLSTDDGGGDIRQGSVIESLDRPRRSARRSCDRQGVMDRGMAGAWCRSATFFRAAEVWAPLTDPVRVSLLMMGDGCARRARSSDWRTVS
jgi:hypothetical protein